MSDFFDPRCHIGEVHGIYKLVDVLENKDKYGHYIYKGVCNKCGFEKFSHYGGFSGSKSVTTICNHLDAAGKYVRPTQWNNKRLGKIFRGMNARCYDINEESYRWYGANRIKICDEWLNDPKKFESWSIENGYSDGLTIDRIDETKDYRPENCRWITLTDNAKYKSTTRLIDVDGEMHTGREWADILNIGTNIVNTYIRKYGVDNTIEFIRRCKNKPLLKPKYGQSYYNLYMDIT